MMALLGRVFSRGVAPHNRSAADEAPGGEASDAVDDAVAVDAVVPIEVADGSGLAEELHSE